MSFIQYFLNEYKIYSFIELIVLWGIIEFIAYRLLFPYIRKRYSAIEEIVDTTNTDSARSSNQKEQKEDISKKNAVMKGLIERLCLIFSLILGFPQMLIAFGVLKVGVKLGNKSDIPNDHYLVGNLVSIIIVFVVYSIALKYRLSF